MIAIYYILSVIIIIDLRHLHFPHNQLLDHIKCHMILNITTLSRTIWHSNVFTTGITL